MAKAMLLARMKALQAPARLPADETPPVASAAEVSSIPRTSIPVFNGQQTEWETFKELFLYMLKNKHNNDPVMKLQLLMNSVDGKAKNRLKGMKMIGTNLDVAWDKLLRRYDNRKRRFTTHLDTLINLKPASRKNIEEMNRLLDSADEAVQGLKDLACPVEHWDNFLVHCLVSKLDPETRETWKISQETVDGFPTYKSLNTFLEKRVQSLEQAHTSGEVSKATPTNNSRKQKSITAHTTHPNQDSESATPKHKKNKAKCSICSEAHATNQCESFNKLSPAQRLELCKKESRCINCLKKGHSTSDCNSTGRCYVCQDKHHTKLHQDKIDQPESISVNTAIASESREMQSTATFMIRSCHTCLLPTVKVWLMNKQGQKVPARGLIDQGATMSFVCEHIVQALDLPKRHRNIRVTEVGASTTAVVHSEVSLTLLSNIEDDFKVEFSALVLGKLTQLLPATEAVDWSWNSLAGLPLADPDLHQPAKIDFILGADVFPTIIRAGLHTDPEKAMVAQATALGWIITGVPKKGVYNSPKVIASLHAQTEPTLSDTLQKYWELEEINSKPPLSPAEEACETHFKETHSRDESGRFIVKYLFTKPPIFPDSREVAVACLLRSEKRRRKNPDLEREYNEFMQTYISLGYMEAVDDKDDFKCCYLPHHLITKVKTTADTDGKAEVSSRVVFNASKQYGNGESFNDCLLPGPKLQADITDIITRWRVQKFVFTTDIKKMFRQILIHPDDRNWQRIVWRGNANEHVKDFRLKTVTYGTKSAPFLALRVIQQLATDGEGEYPLAAKALQNSCYMDDILTGAEEVDTAIQLRNQLIAVLQSAGMQLGKWSANNTKLLEGLTDVDEIQHSIDFIDVVSTFGLKWNPLTDEFCFKVAVENVPNVITKRHIASEAAKLFDPLGWLAPVLIRAKIILQDLWCCKTEWDQPISGNILEAWTTFRSQLPTVEEVSISRWFTVNQVTKWQLHACADASKRAYAAAVYIVPENGQPRLIMAKSKVAPTKTISLPRLELCGAVLAVKLVAKIKEQLPIQPESIHCWSDSKVVLAWLDCPTCVRYGARAEQQQMAPLPAVRITPHRTFACTGLDYAGPITVKCSSGRGIKTSKGYIAIFICLATKAVHVEVVSDLTTEAFLAAYDRFTARRGHCEIIYSDNATTFKGAAAEMQSSLQAAAKASEEVAALIAKDGTTWKFIPPGAPHFGGLWEAAVKSFKFHMIRVIGDTVMTYEELGRLDRSSSYIVVWRRLRLVSTPDHYVR